MARVPLQMSMPHVENSEPPIHTSLLLVPQTLRYAAGRDEIASISQPSPPSETGP